MIVWYVIMYETQWYILYLLQCFNPIGHWGVHCARDRFFCLLLEHQGSWGNEIFREFLKFIKVFGLKFFFSKNLYLGVVFHLFASSLKSKKWCLPYECPNSPNKSWIYWLFFIFCSKYKNEWLRRHKLYQCKQFQLMFGKQVLLYV